MDQQNQWHLFRYGRPIQQLGGRYTLLHLLGRGGMADVCLAWDEQNKREVAAKVMIPDVLDSRKAQRFLDEGATAVSLHHQHITHVYDYGDRVQAEIYNVTGSIGNNELTIPYIIMEHVKKGNLKEWLEKKWLERGRACPLDEILCIFEQLCAAVQYVHSRDMVHRDIKPANILFRELPRKSGQVEVVLSDFGLTVGDNDTLSQPSAGTLAYMAPEQRRGDPQKASDIFSLGVVLYQLCTGHLPFQMNELILPLQQPWRPTLLNPSLPSALDGVILRALLNEPSQRFANASLFWQAIQSAVSQAPSPQVTRANPIPNRPASNEAQSATLPSVFQRSLPPADADIAGTFGPSPNGAQSATLPSVFQAPVLSVAGADMAGTASLGPNIDNDDHWNKRSSVQGQPVPANLPNAPAMTRATGSAIAAGASPTNTDKASVELVAPPETDGTHPPARNLPPAEPAWSTVLRPKSLWNRTRRAIIIIALVIMTLFLSGDRATWVNRSVITNPTIPPNVIPLATIIITPTSKTVQDTYQMQGVTSNANANKLQVTVRQLETTQTDTKQVTATGHSHQDALSASGNITFFNSSLLNTFEVPAGTTFQVSNVQIVIDETAVVPTAIVVSLLQPGQTTVPAHAVQGGTAGNIAAFAINQSCCGSTSITAQNQNAFTGGKDVIDYQFLQQSDVDGVTNANKNTLTQDAQNNIQDQIKTGEQLLGNMKCDDVKTTANESIGDQGPDKAINSAKVTVTEHCNAKVYDANTTRTIAQNLLKEKADKELGPGYVPPDNIVTQTKPQVQPNGNVTFVVTAQGVWSYRWTAAMKQELLNKIKGKSVKDAQAILDTYPGNARIAISNGGDTLPTDASQIKLEIKTVTGLSG